MNFLRLRQRARALWPDSLPHARHNRAAWLRAVARLGDKWILRGGTARWGHGGQHDHR